MRRIDLLRVVAAAAGALVVSFAFSSSAGASYHLASISEVHADGDGVGPDHDYVELQFYAPGQNLLAGHWVATYANTGALLSKSTLGNVILGDSQRTALIVRDGSDSGSDIQSFTMQIATGVGGGAVCYTDGDPQVLPVAGIDCVAYGSVTTIAGSPSPTGAPALPGTGLSAGQSLHRSIARGCPTLLEATDDTNDSAADFSLGPPSPRLNNVTPPETPCAVPVAATPFNLKAAIRRCKKKFPTGPKRKKCIRKAKRRAQA